MLDEDLLYRLENLRKKQKRAEEIVKELDTLAEVADADCHLHLRLEKQTVARAVIAAGVKRLDEELTKELRGLI